MQLSNIRISINGTIGDRVIRIMGSWMRSRFRPIGRTEKVSVSELTDETTPTSEFQLELVVHQPVQKILVTGELIESQGTLLTGAFEGLVGVALEVSESILSPFLLISKEHSLYVSVNSISNTDSSASVRIEYTLSKNLDDWLTLADVKVGGTTALQEMNLEISLSSLANRTCRFRVTRFDKTQAMCYLVLFRICPRHRVGRVNALSSYDFRIRSEISNFSGAAYTHSMYGESTQAPNRQGIVKEAPQKSKLADTAFNEEQFARARRKLTPLVPKPGESAFNYAMRALGNLLPMSPPDFFARANRMSTARPLRMLSICAGAARIEEQILSHCTGPIELTLLDASTDLIQRAAGRLVSTYPEQCFECLIGDINDGLPDGGLFDVIICVSALHHVADLETVLCQVNSRLTDEGEFWSIGEQIGRNGNRLWPEAYEAANRAFAALPDHLRLNARTKEIDTVLSDRDFSLGCFEGIRSEELEHLLEAYLVPEQVYKRNAFLWRLVDTTYSDNYSLDKPEDLEHLRALVIAEALYWSGGGRSTEMHGVYRKKHLER